jgi:hypothetical protein
MKGIWGGSAIAVASIAMLDGVRSSAEGAALNRGLGWLRVRMQGYGAPAPMLAALAATGLVRIESAHTHVQTGRNDMGPGFRPREGRGP